MLGIYGRVVDAVHITRASGPKKKSLNDSNPQYNLYWFHKDNFINVFASIVTCHVSVLMKTASSQPS